MDRPSVLCHTSSRCRTTETRRPRGRAMWPQDASGVSCLAVPKYDLCAPRESSTEERRLAGVGAKTAASGPATLSTRPARAIQTERAQITKARGFVGGREVRSGSGVQPRRRCRDPAHACARSRRRRRDTGRYSGPACSAQGHALRTPTRGGRTLSEPQKPAVVRDSSRLLADGGVSGSSQHVRARETAAACSLGAPSPR